MAASATFALKPGVWFRRGRLLMVSPDPMGTACPLSGRNSTYRPVQISGTGSMLSINVFRGVSEQHCFKIGVRRATLIQRKVNQNFVKGRANDAVK
jgi:hypothetical protein